jgi:hypothetical protein
MGYQEKLCLIHIIRAVKLLLFYQQKITAQKLTTKHLFFYAPLKTNC